MKNKIVWLLVAACVFVSSLSFSAERKKDRLLEKGEPNVQEQQLTINFDKVQLLTIIKYISEQTGKNFMIDDTVRGTVTVISPTKVSVGEALQVLTSILDAKGFSLVTTGKMIKVVPKREARQAVIDTFFGSTPPETETSDIVVTQIVPLEYAQAEDVRKLLVPFVSKDANLLSYSPTNSLVVTDTAGNISRLIEMINAVDVPAPEMETRILFLQHAEAKTMSSKLLSIFQTGKQAAPARRAPNRKQAAPQKMVVAEGRDAKVIADERTNALIIVSDADTADIIEKLVTELDREIPIGRDNIRVIYLKNSDAEQLSNVLNDIKTKTDQGKQQVNPVHKNLAMRSTKSLIVADKLTNSLIITASPEEFATYNKVIEMLDIPRHQVVVEALIAEVKLSDLDRVGLDWNSLTVPDEDELAPYGVMNYGLTAEAMGGSLLGFSGGVYKGNKDGDTLPSIGAIINLYGNDQNFNILSTPHLITTDNQEAEIIVGQTVPFLKSSRVTETETVVKTYDYEDVGITLRITPHVTDDSQVRLDIYQKITAILDVGTLEAPTTTKREAKTTVTVRNGETVAIGGLVSNDRSLVVHKIPLLGDIPILKHLFSRQQWKEQKTNLLIFITPKIISRPGDLQAISRQKEQDQETFIKEEAPRYLNPKPRKKADN